MSCGPFLRGLTCILSEENEEEHSPGHGADALTALSSEILTLGLAPQYLSYPLPSVSEEGGASM